MIPVINSGRNRRGLNYGHYRCTVIPDVFEDPWKQISQAVTLFPVA